MGVRHFGCRRTVPPVPTATKIAILKLGSNLDTRLVDTAGTAGLARSDLARRPCIAGGHIERRVSQEEVAWSQQQRHGLCRHDGEILGSREVSQAKGVPEDNVFILNVLGGVGVDPQRQALGGLARGLGHVAAGRMNLVVRV